MIHFQTEKQGFPENLYSYEGLKDTVENRTCSFFKERPKGNDIEVSNTSEVKEKPS